MKKYILLLGILCVCGLSVQAQFMISQELRRGLEKETQGVGLGFSLQYLHPIKEKFSVGSNVGFLYDIGLKNEHHLKRFSIPMLAIGRYYMIGSNYDGGFYTQLELGMEIFRMKLDYYGTKETFKNNYAKTQISLGYRFGQTWEGSFRFGLLFSKDPMLKYIGIRLGRNIKNTSIRK